MNRIQIGLRVMVATTGLALAYWGLKKGGAFRNALGIAGAWATLSGLWGAAGGESTGKREFRDSVTILAPADEAFAALSRFEEFPRFMRRILDVQRTGDRTWRWVVKEPLGQWSACDIEITRFEKNRFIAWRSIRPAVPFRCEVHLEEMLLQSTAGGGRASLPATRVLVVITQRRPSGPIGSLIARLSGADLGSSLSKELRTFKRLIESRRAASPGTAVVGP